MNNNPSLPPVTHQIKLGISAKKQIVIPEEFFELLGFSHEAVCFVRDGELIIRPLGDDENNP